MNTYLINKLSYNEFIGVLTMIIFFSCQSDSEYTHKQISEFSNDKDSISYSIGADIGDNLISQGVEIDYDAFFTGLKNGYEKNEHLLTMLDRKALFKNMLNSLINRLLELIE